MALDVYRSCSWSEKREVLYTFWRIQKNPTERILRAALQYGPFAIASISVIAFELLLVLLASVIGHYRWGWIDVLVELMVLASLRWSIIRYRTLKQSSLV